MGTQNSKPLSQLTTDELAARLEGLGQAYKGYAGTLRQEGVDGDLVDSFNEAEFSQALDDLGVDRGKFLQRRVITKKWMALKDAEKDTQHAQKLLVAAKPDNNNNKNLKDPELQGSPTSVAVHPTLNDDVIVIDCDDDAISIKKEESSSRRIKQEDEEEVVSKSPQPAERDGESTKVAIKKEEQEEEDTKPSAIVSNSGTVEKPSSKRKKSASPATNTRSAKKKSAAAAVKKAPPERNNKPVDGPTPVTRQVPSVQGGATRAPDRLEPALVASIKIEETAAVKDEADALKASKSGKVPIESLPPDRQERNKAWLNANMDPVTKNGRAVFRRGCHPQCITTILGGTGTHPWPLLTRDPPTDPITGTPNRFISKGEFYVAGEGNWNPWGPVFPGDYGLVNEEAFILPSGFLSDQESFHFFVQCGKNKWDSNYQGPHAKGGYLYVGKYKRMAQEGEVQEEKRTFPYKSMSEKSQKTVAEFYYKRFLHWEGWRFGQEAEHKEDWLIPQIEAMADWKEWTEKDKGIWIWKKLLHQNDFSFDLVPVEFVSYDEDLYRALVDIGAATNRKGSDGHVSTDYAELGPV